MDFLYFPEDKTEYISAFIMLVFIMIGAVAAMFIIYKKSKKEEKRFDEEFKHILNNEHDDSKSPHNDNESK